MIKAVIFDLDGTIADTLPLCIAAFRKSIEPLAGKELSDEEIVATFGPSEEGTIQQLIPQDYHQGLKDYLKYYREQHDMCPRPFEGIIEIIDHLRDSKIIAAMVTGKGPQSTEISLEHYGLKDKFAMIETGWAKGPRKVEGISAVLNKFNINPEETVYVGDTVSDIVSAREVKVPVISAAWSSTADISALQQNKPDMLFKKVEEFKDYLCNVIQ